jgi:membrane fusion protein, multidrug efflux system
MLESFGAEGTMENNRSKSRMISTGLVFLGILIVLKLTVFSKPDKKISASQEPRNQTLSVRTIEVSPVKITDQFTTSGTILSNEQVEIRPEITGKIERIYFTEGTRVKKGELLIKINDSELQAQLLRARHRLTLANSQMNRQQQLIEKKLVSQEEFDTIFSERNVAQADMQLIQTQIDKTEIKAPFDGEIGLRFVSEGSYISPATAITFLVDSSQVKIDFAIPEKYAGAVALMDPITFTVQSTPQEFSGEIYAMDSKIDALSRTLRVLARSPNPDGVLTPGAYANVILRFRERETIMIPTETLISELKGHRVFLLRDGKAESQQVDIGIRSSDQVEIVRGLSTGDMLIASALLQLRPGMAVKPL